MKRSVTLICSNIWHEYDSALSTTIPDLIYWHLSHTPTFRHQFSPCSDWNTASLWASLLSPNNKACFKVTSKSFCHFDPKIDLNWACSAFLNMLQSVVGNDLLSCTTQYSFNTHLIRFILSFVALTSGNILCERITKWGEKNKKYSPITLNISFSTAL